MTIRIILTRFAVSTFCIFHFFLKVPKNPLEKVYCYSSHTKPLISITAWIPVQGGFGEVCPSATAVMKASLTSNALVYEHADQLMCPVNILIFRNQASL